VILLLVLVVDVDVRSAGLVVLTAHRGAGKLNETRVRDVNQDVRARVLALSHLDLALAAGRNRPPDVDLNGCCEAQEVRLSELFLTQHHVVLRYGDGRAGFLPLVVVVSVGVLPLFVVVSVGVLPLVVIVFAVAVGEGGASADDGDQVAAAARVVESSTEQTDLDRVRGHLEDEHREGRKIDFKVNPGPRQHHLSRCRHSLSRGRRGWRSVRWRG